MMNHRLVLLSSEKRRLEDLIRAYVATGGAYRCLLVTYDDRLVFGQRVTAALLSKRFAAAMIEDRPVNDPLPIVFSNLAMMAVAVVAA
jgi:hypothetical protein